MGRRRRWKTARFGVPMAADHRRILATAIGDCAARSNIGRSVRADAARLHAVAATVHG
jgi:hypothetical protein